MPKGVETYVDGGGFAVVDFVDPSLRGSGLAKLIEIGGPESVETITRDGPRRKYRVPEGNANEAGLIDNASSVDATASGDVGYAAHLAAQSRAVPGNPGLAAHSRGANDAGPVEQSDVLGNQSVSTTESQTAAPATDAAPLHADLVAKMAAARNEQTAVVRERAAELADQRPAQTSAANVNASLAGQSAALATDPQSRGGEGLVPVVESPSLDWTRTQIDAHAATVHGIDTKTEPNKQAALDKIEGAKS